MPQTELPEDPAERIEMHRAMLSHVQKIDQGIRQHAAVVDRELETVAQTRPGSLDHRKLIAAKKDLRQKHLCLMDQERRLKERIELLNTQIGNLMAALTVDV
ncbi:MAG: hypothetical protein PHD57_06880 [Desulfobacterales bacterium]|nr:hypothetical protein [Desulfobacterales bacterium]MDD3951940.1 hypothetical protein [Desulfobacterales bacterium]